jgi:hypothetical protein
MSAHRKVAIDSAFAQSVDQCTELRDIELKDQREADQNRIERLDTLNDQVRVDLKIDDFDFVTVFPKSRCEITDSEIALLLKSDENYGS